MKLYQKTNIQRTNINKIRILILFSFILFFITTNVFGQRIISANTLTWTVLSGVITEAGNDYSSEYLSSANQIELNTIVPLLLASGKVSVHQQGTLWHDQLKLSIKRTGNGTKLGVCVGCYLNGNTTDFIPITNSSTDLFEVYAILSLASFEGIPLQLKLTGVSVTIPAKNYITNVVFTIGPL